MDKTHLQGLKNLNKNIFNVLRATLDENLILKTKVQKFTQHTGTFDIFEFLKLV